MNIIPIYYDTLTNRWGYREDLVLLEATDLELGSVLRDDMSPQDLLKASSTEQKAVVFTAEDAAALEQAIEKGSWMDGNAREYFATALQLAKKLTDQLQ
jgi:hypothetical protein